MLLELIEKIDTNWHYFLIEETKKPYFKHLDEQVTILYKKFSCQPQVADIFKVFSFFNVEETKVVILGQDPYYQKNIADGLAFSTKAKVIPGSLRNIYKEMENCNFHRNRSSGDLTYLAKQGVLLLNTCLTVTEYQPFSHWNLGWEIFIKNCLTYLTKQTSVAAILWGNAAKHFTPFFLNDKNLLLISAHPSPRSCHFGFFGNNHFLKCNNFLRTVKKEPIAW